MTIPSNPAFHKPRLFKRVIIFLLVCAVAIIAFYATLVSSAKPISYDQKKLVRQATGLLEERGFSSEAWYLTYLASFRSTDNWLNASVEKDNAYAATNFPFEIMTLYPDFFIVPVDDTERAAILLHEAKHMQGKDEKEAYEFVWQNRKRLGWTSDKYGGSDLWLSVRNQTKQYSPYLFACTSKPLEDCTE